MQQRLHVLEVNSEELLMRHSQLGIACIEHVVVHVLVGRSLGLCVCGSRCRSVIERPHCESRYVLETLQRFDVFESSLG